MSIMRCEKPHLNDSEKDVECIGCGHKEVCKYFRDVVSAWNARKAISRGKCIYFIERDAYE